VLKDSNLNMTFMVHYYHESKSTLCLFGAFWSNFISLEKQISLFMRHDQLSGAFIFTNISTKVVAAFSLLRLMNEFVYCHGFDNLTGVGIGLRSIASLAL